MKKLTSLLIIFVLLCASVFSLASCKTEKTLTGTYKADIAVKEIYYEFDIFHNVTKTEKTILGDDKVSEGTYEFNDDGSKLTMTFGDESTTYSFATIESGDKEYIRLNLTTYEKID